MSDYSAGDSIPIGDSEANSPVPTEIEANGEKEDVRNPVNSSTARRAPSRKVKAIDRVRIKADNDRFKFGSISMWTSISTSLVFGFCAASMALSNIITGSASAVGCYVAPFVLIGFIGFLLSLTFGVIGILYGRERLKAAIGIAFLFLTNLLIGLFSYLGNIGQ